MDIVARAAVVFVFVWLVLRALGRRQLGELTAFELVLLFVIGDLVQQSITQNDTSVMAAVLAIGTIALLIVTQSYVAYRWPRTRPVVDGRPLVVVAQGQTVDTNLRSQRMSVDDVHEAARQQGIHDVADIEYAVLEADGRISFLTVDGRPRPPEHGIAG